MVGDLGIVHRGVLEKQSRSFEDHTMKKLSLVYFLVFLIGGLSAQSYYRNYAEEAQAASTTGERIYLESCAACHGAKGDGKGPEADRLKTKPRDFSGGMYKFRSTPSGSLPLDEDIFRTISRGVRTTSMLAQLHLSEKERWAVTEYLKTLAPRFKAMKTPEPISIPAQPSPDAELLALGTRMYADAGCIQCHGSGGKGDGTSAKDLKDDGGEPISPTDLTLKPFKSGPKLEDLYRTLSTGLNGTPMASYAEALTPKERWSLVFYVVSIATKDRPRGMMGLVGEEVQGMRIDMRAAMAGMMGGRGGMMDRNMRDRMKNMMGR
jgi:cytochrome c oxidase cbb3-type subunit 2